MKSILVPTDFSESADNALIYAMDLAQKESAKIILLHVYHMEPSISYIDVPVPDDEIKITNDKWMEKLRTLQVKIAHAGGIQSELVARLDLAVDGIVREAEERNVDLIIMGTHGESGLKDLLFGSITSRVIDQAHCPVIAVPKGALYHPMRKIAYACNYSNIDIETLSKLLEIAAPFNAQLTVLHIYDGDELEAMEEMKRFMEVADKKIVYPNLCYQILGGTDVSKKLEEYMKTEAADLLVISTHEKTFRDKLFTTSTAHELVFHSKVPVMAFHYRKKESIMIV